jgi:hypothetical protein
MPVRWATSVLVRRGCSSSKDSITASPRPSPTIRSAGSMGKSFAAAELRRLEACAWSVF